MATGDRTRRGAVFLAPRRVKGALGEVLIIQQTPEASEALHENYSPVHSVDHPSDSTLLWVQPQHREIPTLKTSLSC